MYHITIPLRNLLQFFQKNFLRFARAPNQPVPSCHGTGCFLASPRSYAIKSLEIINIFPKSFEALKQHWLISALIGALVYNEFGDTLNAALLQLFWLDSVMKITYFQITITISKVKHNMIHHSISTYIKCQNPKTITRDICR